MTDRERFRHIMAYEPVDRLPVMALEPYETEALERWRGEGLPEGADVVEHLGMARMQWLPCWYGPIPGFDIRVLEEDDEYIVETTYLGATVRKRKDRPTLFYGHIDHPVKTRADWEEYKQRFLPHPGRLPEKWETEVAPALNASDQPVGLLVFPYFFRTGFYGMGMERFLSAFHEEPDLMHDIFAHYTDMVVATIRPALEHARVDVAVIAEDYAGKNGPLISPTTYREFWVPHQARVMEVLRGFEVPVICQWSAGRFQELLPEMMDEGFNCTWPLELMSGMEANELRRDFGRELRLAGNIPKEAAMAGRAAIDEHIERLMPLIREGGFIPALDDMGAPDMSWDSYRYMVERLQAVRL